MPYHRVGENQPAHISWENRGARRRKWLRSEKLHQPELQIHFFRFSWILQLLSWYEEAERMNLLLC